MESWDASGCVPHPQDFNQLLLFAYAIDNSVRPMNDFADVVQFEFRHDATEQREGVQLFCLGDDFVSEPFRRLRIFRPMKETSPSRSEIAG